MRIVLILLLTSSMLSYSQDCTFIMSGKVSDLHDGKPLSEALLLVAGTNISAETDSEGKFILKGLCDRSYSIQVAHPSCSTKIFSVKVKGNSTRNFKLEHHLEEFNEITVTGKAFDEKSKTMNNATISRAEIERLSSGNLGDALSKISGVSSLSTGNAILKPLINGLHSSRVVVVNNGVRMQDQEWGAEHAPNIDINVADNITLIKGAGALQYGGDAIGGVIIAESAKAPVKDTIFGKTILSGLSNGQGGTITTRLTKSTKEGLSFAIQGTLKRFGDFETPEYILSNTGLFERNASVQIALNKFNYTLEGYYSLFKNEIGILRASHLGGAQDQVNAIGSDVPLIINPFTYDINAPKQDVTHHLARIKASKLFDGFGKLSLQYDFQINKRLEFDIRRGDDRDKASLDLELLTHSLALDLESNLSDKLSLKSGLLGRFQDNTANPNTGVRRLIPDYKRYDIAAYGILDYEINNEFTLEFGGRFDYVHLDAFKFYRTSLWEARNYDELFQDIVVEELENQILTNPKLNYNNASATIGLSYTLNNSYDLLFNYSLASRAPNPSELFSEGLHHSASRIEIGDLRFKSEVGHKFALTFKKEKSNFNFNISPFVNYINDFNLIEPTEVQQTIRGNFQVWEYRQTDALLVGFDFDASYKFTNNLGFTHQFSMVKGYDRSTDKPLINMPPVETKNELVYKNEKLKNVRLALQSQYVFRQNEFPNNNFEVFIPQLGSSEIVDVSTPPNAYHLLNFNSSFDLNMSQTSILTIGFGINNILDTDYRNYLNRLRYYADDLGRNFLVSLKLNY